MVEVCRTDVHAPSMCGACETTNKVEFVSLYHMSLLLLLCVCVSRCIVRMNLIGSFQPAPVNTEPMATLKTLLKAINNHHSTAVSNGWYGDIITGWLLSRQH